MVLPGQEKHVACARCRERKVKCDGGRPSCRRCLRNHASCHYARGRKQQAKNEWAQHLRTFSSQPRKARVARSNLVPSTTQPLLPRASTTGFGDLSTGPTFSHTRCRTLCSVDGAEPFCSTTSASSTPDPGCYSSSPTGTGEWLSTDSSTIPLLEDLDSHSAPRAFAFYPSSTFCETNYTSAFLTTHDQFSFSGRPALFRSQTPSSETTSTSYEGLVDFPYASANIASYTSVPSGPPNRDQSNLESSYDDHSMYAATTYRL